jgi:hypothetical protein
MKLSAALMRITPSRFGCTPILIQNSTGAASTNQRTKPMSEITDEMARFTLDEIRTIGQKIYWASLSDRRGLAYRQLEIDDETWQDINEAIGLAAVKAVAPMIERAVLEKALQAVANAGWYQQTLDVSWTHVDNQIDHAETAIRALIGDSQ